MRIFSNDIAGSFLNLFFPPICTLCKKGMGKEGLCPDCSNGIERISSPLCAVCGIPFEATSTGDRQESDHPCGECLLKSPPFLKARSSVYYRGAAAEAIHRFKYGGDLVLTSTLGALTFDAVDLLDEKNFDFILPVPLHPERLRERGFNQSLLIARELGKKLGGVKVDCFSLKRIRPTLSQVGLKGKERYTNVKGAFALTDAAAFKGKTVLLVDDVYTTGATIKECSKTLKKAKARVFAVTLARTTGL